MTEDVLRLQYHAIESHLCDVEDLFQAIVGKRTNERFVRDKHNLSFADSIWKPFFLA